MHARHAQVRIAGRRCQGVAILAGGTPNPLKLRTLGKSNCGARGDMHPVKMDFSYFRNAETNALPVNVPELLTQETLKPMGGGN